MDWAQCFNEAIRFLENDLTQPPDVEAAARIAGCSVFHFQRMFAYVAGMPLSQYLRRRKMSLAAEELQKRRQDNRCGPALRLRLAHGI